MTQVKSGMSRGVSSDFTNWDRKFLLLIVILGLVRLLFLIVSPLELSPDEAYYWDWSRHLAFGYYSKPPMVAWLIWLSTHLLPQTEFGVRFPAVLLNFFTTLGIFLLARKMAGARAGLLAALSYSATVGSAVSGYIMTIDAPLLCFWIWTLYFFWRARESELGRGSRKALALWALSGLFCGLALLSKQTSVALSGACALFFILSLGPLRAIRHKGAYVFFGIQLLVLVPFLLWNYNHGWITFVHTAHHFEQAEKTYLFRLDTFLELIGSQAGLITPIIFISLFCASLWAVREIIKSGRNSDQWQERVSQLVLLVLSGPLPLLAVFILSLKQRVNANWPAPFYLSLSVLLGLWLVMEGVSGKSAPFPGCRRLYRPGIILGAVLVAILYALPFLFVHTPLSGSKIDPTVRLRGWKALASKADAFLSSFPDPERTFIVARRRQSASELAFYMAGKPRVYRWNGFDRKIKSQYELWPSPIDKKGWDALVVVEEGKGLDGLEQCFRNFFPLGKIRVRLGRDRLRLFNVYEGRGLKKWASR